MYYSMNIAGLDRKLPLCRITDDLYIAGFVILGDPELCEACARDLLKISPEYDYILTAETKGIPLAHEMARLHGDKKYFIARKSPKLYMQETFEADVRSITTAGQQKLFLDKADADELEGRKILVVDDVVSTGESLLALEKLVSKTGGHICGKVCVLAEGDAAKRDDVKFLEYLPLFNADGTVKD